MTYVNEPAKNQRPLRPKSDIEVRAIRERADRERWVAVSVTLAEYEFPRVIPNRTLLIAAVEQWRFARRRSCTLYNGCDYYNAWRGEKLAIKRRD